MAEVWKKNYQELFLIKLAFRNMKGYKQPKKQGARRSLPCIDAGGTGPGPERCRSFGGSPAVH